MLASSPLCGVGSLALPVHDASGQQKNENSLSDYQPTDYTEDQGNATSVSCWVTRVTVNGIDTRMLQKATRAETKQ